MESLGDRKFIHYHHKSLKIILVIPLSSIVSLISFGRLGFQSISPSIIDFNGFSVNKMVDKNNVYLIIL